MDEFDDVYEMLEESAVDSEGTRHWESNRQGLPSYTSYYVDSAASQNIEMSAYVLRAIIIKNIPNVALEGSLIARWLVGQRNSRGGFSSTQDTVIGLTALAEFAKLGSATDADLVVTMNIRGGESLEFDVTSENRFLIQRSSFDSFPAEISVLAEGRGCVLFTVAGDYYIKKEKQVMDPFTLNINTIGQKPSARRKRRAEEEVEEREGEEETCDKFTISISARYNGEDGASNMAIINFRPVSGFVFDEDSLGSLKSKYDFLRRYELNEDTITFYFDEITNEEIEFEFDVSKEFDVEDTKPAFITIVDYYENGLKVAEEFEFVCADEEPEPTSPPTTTYTTPFSPTGYASSTPTVEPDFDECAVPGICGGPEYECINFPGTYECLCAEGYQLDEQEVNCIGIPSCPICDASGLPEDSDEALCSADFIQVIKVRVDETLRPLNDMNTRKDIKERIYYDLEIDDACTCDLITSGARIIVIASSDHIGLSSGRRDKRILLDDSVIIVSSLSSVKKDIFSVIDNC